MSNLPNVPTDISQALRDFLQGIRNTLLSLSTRISSLSTHVSTLSPVVSSVKSYVDRNTSTDPIDPPFNLSITVDAWSHVLTWDNISSNRVSGVEVFYNNINDVSTSQLVATVAYGVKRYRHAPNTLYQNHYYWIRNITWGGSYSTYVPDPVIHGGFLIEGNDTVGAAIDRVMGILMGDNPPLYDGNTAYEAGDIVRWSGADNVVRRYRRKNYSPGGNFEESNIDPSNATYWEQLGILVEGEVDGVATVGVDGNFVVDGTILARHIKANDLTGDKINATTSINLSNGGKLNIGYGGQINIGSGGQINLGVGGGLLGYSYIIDKPTSLSGINSSEGSKLAGIENGATVGAPPGTFVNGILAETLTDDVEAALTAAANAQDTADGKIQSFYQMSAPTSGMSVGDLWIDTDNGNKLHRYDGTSWIDIQDESITDVQQEAAEALVAASTAQATADGKVTTFFGTSTPTAEGIGDLWYNDSTKLVKRWTGSNWAVISNNFTDTSQLSDGAGLGQTAIWDYIVGDNKPEDNATQNNIYRQADEPTGGNYTTGDLWIDTDATPLVLYQWHGTEWVEIANFTTEVGGTGVNFCPVRYSTWPYDTLPDVTVVRGTATLDVAVAYFDDNALKLSATDDNCYCYLGTSSTGYNISIPPNEKWILSLYVRCSAASQPGQLYLKTEKNGGTFYGKNFTTSPSANTWQRVSGLLDLSADSSTKVLIRVDNDGGSGVDMWIDGIMLEPTIGVAADPSPFGGAFKSSIDGAMINPKSLLRIEEGGAIIVGDYNVVLDSTDTDTGGRIIVAPDGGMAGNDYVLMDSGEIKKVIYDAQFQTHQDYALLSNVQIGTVENGVTTEIPGYFRQKPKVILSPSELPSYDANYPTQTQYIVMGEPIVEQVDPVTQPYKWKVTPRAYLSLGAGEQTNIDASPMFDFSGMLHSMPIDQYVYSPTLNIGLSGVRQVRYRNGGFFACQYWHDEASFNDNNYLHRAYKFWMYLQLYVNGAWVNGASECFTPTLPIPGPYHYTFSCVTPVQDADITAIRLAMYMDGNYLQKTVEDWGPSWFIDQLPDYDVFDKYYYAMGAGGATYDLILTEAGILLSGTVSYMAIG